MTTVTARDLHCVICDDPVGPFEEHHRRLGDRADNRASAKILLCGDLSARNCHKQRVHGTATQARDSRAGRIWAETHGYRISRHSTRDATTVVPVRYQQPSLGRAGWFLLTDAGELVPTAGPSIGDAREALAAHEVIAPGAVRGPAQEVPLTTASGKRIGTAEAGADDRGVWVLGRIDDDGAAHTLAENVRGYPAASFAFTPVPGLPRTIRHIDLRRGSLGVHPGGDPPMAPPTAKIELDWAITLDTAVRVLRPQDERFEEDADPFETVSLGALIARQVLENSAEALMMGGVLQARLEQVTDEELRAYARNLVASVAGGHLGAASTGAELTLADRIAAEVWRQVSIDSPTAATRGRSSAVIDAVIATAVTDAFRDMAATIVGQVRAKVLAEIGNHARGYDDSPVKPGDRPHGSTRDGA